MRPKRMMIMLLIVSILAGNICTGCWNSREPELLGVVLAVGFDYDEEGDLYEVIVQIANPLSMGDGSGSTSGGGGESSGGKNSFWTASSRGQTPFEAIRNLSEISSRAMFWSHCRIVFFSEKLARRGIKDILDLFEREREFRLSAKPVVVDGDLRKLMEADFPLEDTGVRGLDRMIVTTLFERSIYPQKNLTEIIAAISQPGKEMIIGRIEMLESEKKNSGGGTGGNAPPPARIGGGALFRGYRMVGWVNARQIQGWAYGTGRSIRSNFIVESPLKKGSYASIEVFGHKAQMRLCGDEKNWRIELKVKMHGRIQEFEGSGKLDTENELTRSLERRAAQAVRNSIEAMLSRSQELKADVFGFGNLIYRKQPRLWQEIGPRWDEEIFPRLSIDLQVEFKLQLTGLITNPL